MMFFNSIHDEIKQKAYYKWKDASEPEGKSLKFWLEAEKELRPSWRRIELTSPPSVTFFHGYPSLIRESH